MVMEKALETFFNSIIKFTDDYQKDLFTKIYNEIMEKEKLNDLIIDWAKQRDLLKSENASKQLLKLSEEVGELSGAYLKGKVDEQIDAIGDIQVVLIILSKQLGIDYEESLVSAYEVIKSRTGKTVNGSFIKD